MVLQSIETNVDFIKTILVSNKICIAYINMENVKKLDNFKKYNNLNKLANADLLLKLYYPDGLHKDVYTRETSMIHHVIQEINCYAFVYLFITNKEVLRECYTDNIHKLTNSESYRLLVGHHIQLQPYLYKENECILVKPFLNINESIPINMVVNFDVCTFYPSVYLWDHLFATFNYEFLTKASLDQSKILPNINKMLEYPFIELPENLRIYDGKWLILEGKQVIPLRVNDYTDLTMRILLKHMILLYELNLKYDHERCKEYRTTNILLARHLFYVSQLDRILLYHKNITIKINPLNKKLYKMYGNEVKLHTFMKNNQIYSNKLIDEHSHFIDEYAIIHKITQSSDYTIEDMNIV